MSFHPDILFDYSIHNLKPLASFLAIGVFALVGMQIFGGKMFSCNSSDVQYPDGKAVCSGNYAIYSKGYLQPRAWSRPEHNFDTAYYAFL